MALIPPDLRLASPFANSFDIQVAFFCTKMTLNIRGPLVKVAGYPSLAHRP